MTPTLREYLTKGVFLGLWAYLAVCQATDAGDWPRFLRVVLWLTGGLLAGLAVGAFTQIRRGFRPATNPTAFPLVVLFESPYWVYLGVVGGLGLGLVVEYDPKPERNWLGYFAAGGLVLGFGLARLREVPNWAWRTALSVLVGGLLTYLAVSYLDEFLGLEDAERRKNVGVALLLGLPFFYLLTFCGEAEESEVEIAALCAGLGVGLHLIGLDSGTGLLGGKIVFLAPIVIYGVYAIRVLPGLRVFKHVLRGYSALNVGNLPGALVAFKRGLRLNPASELAAEGMWAVHQKVDVTALPADSPLLGLLDYQFCLDQAASAVLGDRPPTDGERAKADRMLDLVERQQPRLAPRVDYLRAVSLAHGKQFDRAAEVLSRLLDPTVPADAGVRKPALLAAWDLALRLLPQLVARLGPTELAKPGRRMEAIGAVERALAARPADPTANALKEGLYASLTEGEFAADAASGPPTDFNYDYVEQVGLALADAATPEQRDRGMAFLRVAGRGLPARGPGIFSKLAAMADAAGDAAAARGYREQVKRCGLDAGWKAMDPDQRATYFATVKESAAAAEARGDYTAAIDDWELFLEGGSGGLEAFRKLADLYEKATDPINAVRMVETGLLYDKKDRDLLARKDRYYYSIDADRLARVRAKVERFFDADYCLAKAKTVLDQKDSDLELIDWALHLVRLAKVVQPARLAVQLAEARCLLRKGEADAGLLALEDVRDAKPSGSEDQEAWYAATRMLGDIYLNERDRPDLAVRCFLDYRESPKSGADTLFNIARSYEAAGQVQNAIQFYEAVTGYDQHPKYWEASEAVQRLKTGRG